MVKEWKARVRKVWMNREYKIFDLKRFLSCGRTSNEFYGYGIQSN